MMTTWLIDTALFKSLAPGRSQGFRTWLEANDSPVFLSAASLVEIEAAIARVPAGQAQRAQALRKWLEDITTHFGDRIHPVDGKIAVRAGALFAMRVIPDIASTTRCWSRPRNSMTMAC